MARLWRQYVELIVSLNFLLLIIFYAKKINKKVGIFLILTKWREKKIHTKIRFIIKLYAILKDEGKHIRLYYFLLRTFISFEYEYAKKHDYDIKVCGVCLFFRRVCVVKKIETFINIQTFQRSKKTIHTRTHNK